MMKQEEASAPKGMAGPPPTRIGQSFPKVFCKSSVKVQDRGWRKGRGREKGRKRGEEGKEREEEEGGEDRAPLPSPKKPRTSLELCRAEPGEEGALWTPGQAGNPITLTAWSCLAMSSWSWFGQSHPEEEVILGQPHIQAGVCPGSRWGHGVGLGQQRGSCFSGWQELSPTPSCPPSVSLVLPSPARGSA